jgi:hypothetical protein
VPSFVNYKKKGCTRFAAASDKDCQLLAQGRWFSPASSTTKTGCHDIAEILLKKVALKHQKSNQIKSDRIIRCISVQLKLDFVYFFSLFSIYW